MQENLVIIISFEGIFRLKVTNFSLQLANTRAHCLTAQFTSRGRFRCCVSRVPYKVNAFSCSNYFSHLDTILIIYESSLEHVYCTDIDVERK